MTGPGLDSTSPQEVRSGFHTDDCKWNARSSDWYDGESDVEEFAGEAEVVSLVHVAQGWGGRPKEHRGCG